MPPGLPEAEAEAEQLAVAAEVQLLVAAEVQLTVALAVGLGVLLVLLEEEPRVLVHAWLLLGSP